MNNEPHTPHGNTLHEQTEIAALLPRYYETHGSDTIYSIERIMNIDGHEVAWLYYESEIDYHDGTEPEKATGHCVECACHFTENVGWRTDAKHGVVGLQAGTECDKKRAAIGIRHQELRHEYTAKGVMDALQADAPATIRAVVLDLIERCKAGEVLETNNGARFWGGYYYVQSVCEILQLPMKDVLPVIDAMCEDKVIGLEGMVVQPYREPVKPMRYESLKDAPVPTFYEEKPDKIWALVAKPENKDIDLTGLGTSETPVHFTIGQCILGLAHTQELAKARLEHAIQNPRLSHERLYQQSFVEPQYFAGPLTVIAYTASNDTQPEEWVIEAFLGDAVEPEVRTLKMDYPTIFGIDYADQQNVNRFIDEWFPNE